MFLEITREDAESYKQDVLADRANKEGFGGGITCFCAAARAAERKFRQPCSVGTRAIYPEREAVAYRFPVVFYDSHIRIFDAYATAETQDGERCAETQRLAKLFKNIQFPVRIPLTVENR